VLVTNLYGSINGWLNSGVLTKQCRRRPAGPDDGRQHRECQLGRHLPGQYHDLQQHVPRVAPGNTATFLGTLTPVGTNYLVGGGGGTLVIGSDKRSPTSHPDQPQRHLRAAP